MSKYYRKRAQQGFSLVELMIAMLLGLLLLVGVVNLFLGSSQTYRLQEALFRVQESGRFALDIMQRDLLNAGFQNVVSNSAQVRPRNKGITAVRGFVNDTGIPAGFVRNGSTSEILRINFNDNPDPGGVDEVYYYLAPDVSGESALYRNMNAVVEGIEELVIEYGVDTSGDRRADVYRRSNLVNVAAWSNVVSVRVSMVVSGGGDGVVETAQTLPAPHAAFDTSDRRMYQVFTMTVSLRNKTS